ncbi:TrmH family RNA methyltransferase [Mycoplasmopsis agassizii]|uniref:RNA methyltransferase n=1 Tax=Mycoplasmopsis agassizii TaxID=33922 RepID=A0ABX4H404_9BACT|nr:RNA methyltransferase [Mycoplasmopsis agassizii]PAF54611.1 RNA methyltransferase [Mycoplasmopsis agassizii]SMC19389.1 RNA methyltransferase, TrmH family [Mycoplasmopsis agassizii]
MISSKSNEQYKILKSLTTKKGRLQHNAFLIEGSKIIEEAKKLNVKLTTYCPKGCDVDLANFLINSISDLESKPDMIAKVEIKKVNLDFKNSKRILYLDNVNDPGNVGTLIRSALAFNFDTVVFSNLDIYNQKITRSSRNATFSVNLIDEKDYKNIFTIFKKYGFKIYGALLSEDAKEINEINFDEKLVVVLGNEGHGISEQVLKILDEKIYIKINQKLESLNVAIAGAIIMNKINS